MIDEATAKDINQNFHDKDVGDPVRPCGGGGDASTKHIVRVVQWKSNPYARVPWLSASTAATSLEPGLALSRTTPTGWMRRHLR